MDKEVRVPPRRKLAGSLLLTFCAWCLLPAVAHANVRVNQNAPGLDEHTTSITLHPDPTGLGPDILIVAYDQNVFGSGGIGTSWSPDQGVTWFDSTVPVAPVFIFNQDASVASDRGSVVYAGFASYDQLPGPGLTYTSGVFVSTSFDGGKTFNPPVAVSNQAGPWTVTPWETKPKVDADGYAAQGSPYAGNVYVVWERDLPTTGWVNGPADVHFATSSNQGVNWTYPVNAMGNNNINDNSGTDLALWPDLDVGSDGSVDVGWVDTHYWLQDQGRLLFDRTLDGGATFGRDIPAVTFWCIPQVMNDALMIPCRVAQSYASVAVDPSNPQRIGMVFAGDPDTGPAYESRVDVGDLPPSSFDLSLLNPTSGASNLGLSSTYAHACWIDKRNSPPDVFYNRMPLTGGPPFAWTGPETVLSTQPALDHNGPNNANIATTASGVYVAWDEWVGIDYAHLIYVNCSGNQGGTWLAQAVPLDSHGRVCYEPWVTADSGDHVTVAWLEDQLSPAGDTDIYVNYSPDGGVTWQSPEIQVPTNYRAFNHDICSWYDTIAGNHYVYLTWAEETSSGAGSIIRFSVSMDGGATWSAPVRLDAAPAGSELAYAPKICCEGTNVYVTWVDRRSGIEDILFNWSSSNGLSAWAGETQLDSPASRDYYSQIACGQGNVYVVYESDRNAPGGNEDIYCNFSVGGGSNWQGERRVDSNPPAAATSVYPRISVGGPDGSPTPCVVWMDDRNSATPYTGWDAYSNFSNNGGYTWGFDFRVDNGDQPGRTETWYPQVTGSSPFYLYRDLRNGVGDLFANLYGFGPDEGDIFYTESTDGGVTWLNPPLRVNDDPGQNDQSHPWIDIKPNGMVDVVWYDNRSDPMDQNMETWFATLQPGASSFSPNQPVSNTPIIEPTPPLLWPGDYIGVAVDTMMAHVVWADNRREGTLYDAFYAAMENPQIIQTGACCLPGGSCQVTSAANCAAQGGVYMGDETICDPDLCKTTGLPDTDILIKTRLVATYPNPFNPSTLVVYELAMDSPVRLTIHDAAGRLVKTLVNEGLQTGGRHEVSWNGRDEQGRRVASGVYLCRLEAASVTDTQRMVLLK